MEHALSLDEELDQIFNPNGQFFFPFNQEEEIIEEELSNEVLAQLIINFGYGLGVVQYLPQLYYKGG